MSHEMPPGETQAGSPSMDGDQNTVRPSAIRLRGTAPKRTPGERGRLAGNRAGKVGNAGETPALPGRRARRRLPGGRSRRAITAEGTGVELSQETPGNTGVDAQGGAKSGSLHAQNAPDDPDLAELTAAWPSLSAGDREAILAITRRHLAGRSPADPPAENRANVEVSSPAAAENEVSSPPLAGPASKRRRASR